MNGGYAMIDFTGLDLGDLNPVPGIYERTRRAIESGKPIVVSGVVNGEQAFTPILAYGGVENVGEVFLSFYPVTLHINEEDEISM